MRAVSPGESPQESGSAILCRIHSPLGLSASQLTCAMIAEVGDVLVLSLVPVSTLGGDEHGDVEREYDWAFAVAGVAEPLPVPVDGSLLGTPVGVG